jgi:hypothetical protein
MGHTTGAISDMLLGMYQIYKVLTIENNQIAAVEREFASGNLLRVAVGTNSPRGDAEDRGRTVFSFEGDSNTDISFEASENSKKVSLVFTGDSECEVLIQALEFAASTLRTMQHANRTSLRAAPAFSAH